ncbi:MAG TPA: DHHW family protein, partial [Bacillota bacterium]|nr:DHHW family protein [Bacillota bacterium]
MKHFFTAVVIIMITAALVFLLLLKLDLLPVQDASMPESSSAVSEMSLAPVSTPEQSIDVSKTESSDASAVSESSQEPEESEAEPSELSEESIVPESLPDESKKPDESIDATERTFGGIKVVLTGAPAGGFTAVDPARTVTVRVSGTSAAVNALTADKISASLDVSALTKAGAKDLKTAVSVPDGITVVSINPKYISVICTANTASTDSSAGNASDTSKDTSLETSKDTSTDTSDDTSKDTSTDTSTDTSDDTSAEAYISNGIIIDGIRAMEQFGGSAKGGAKCASLLNDFKQKVGSKVTVYALAIPTSSGIFAPDKYPASKIKTADCFEGLKNALDGVIYVDALTALTAHKDEYIYFRTDHHWAALGAYYASQAFAQAAGTDFTGLDGFTKETVSTFVGS